MSPLADFPAVAGVAGPQESSQLASTCPRERADKLARQLAPDNRPARPGAGRLGPWARVALLALAVLHCRLRPAAGQCPWTRQSAELHSDCICDFNPSQASPAPAHWQTINRMSVQCAPVDFARLLNALKQTASVELPTRLAEQLALDADSWPEAAANRSSSKLDDDTDADDDERRLLGEQQLQLISQTKLDLLHVSNSSIPRLENNTFLVDDLLPSAAGGSRPLVVAVQALHLSRCSMSHIEPGALNGLEWSLTSLSLSDNRLESVPSAALRRLASLRLLDLSNNNILQLAGAPFARLSKLNTLRLADNQHIGQAEMGARAFAGLASSLVDLSLKNTRLGEFPRAISELRNLTFLNLAQNQISSVPARALSQMNSLTAINLERNRIVRLEEETFAGVEGSLSSLSLLGNLIERFPLDQLAKLAELRRLDLGFNRIDSLPPGAFHANCKLLLVALDGNPLETLPESAFKPLAGTLRGLSVGGKALDCDCRLSWMLRWQLEHQLQISSRERAPQFCAKPAYLRSLVSFAALKPEHLTCIASPNPATAAAAATTDRAPTENPIWPRATYVPVAMFGGGGGGSDSTSGWLATGSQPSYVTIGAQPQLSTVASSRQPQLVGSEPDVSETQQAPTSTTGATVPSSTLTTVSMQVSETTTASVTETTAITTTTQAPTKTATSFTSGPHLEQQQQQPTTTSAELFTAGVTSTSDEDQVDETTATDDELSTSATATSCTGSSVDQNTLPVEDETLSPASSSTLSSYSDGITQSSRRKINRHGFLAANDLLRRRQSASSSTSSIRSGAEQPTTARPRPPLIQSVFGDRATSFSSSTTTTPAPNQRTGAVSPIVDQPTTRHSQVSTRPPASGQPVVPAVPITINVYKTTASNRPSFHNQTHHQATSETSQTRAQTRDQSTTSPWNLQRAFESLSPGKGARFVDEPQVAAATTTTSLRRQQAPASQRVYSAPIPNRSSLLSGSQRRGQHLSTSAPRLASSTTTSTMPAEPVLSFEPEIERQNQIPGGQSREAPTTASRNTPNGEPVAEQQPNSSAPIASADSRPTQTTATTTTTTTFRPTTLLNHHQQQVGSNNTRMSVSSLYRLATAGSRLSHSSEPTLGGGGRSSGSTSVGLAGRAATSASPQTTQREAERPATQSAAVGLQQSNPTRREQRPDAAPAAQAADSADRPLVEVDAPQTTRNKPLAAETTTTRMAATVRIVDSLGRSSPALNNRPDAAREASQWQAAGAPTGRELGPGGSASSAASERPVHQTAATPVSVDAGTLQQQLQPTGNVWLRADHSSNAQSQTAAPPNSGQLSPVIDATGLSDQSASTVAPDHELKQQERDGEESRSSTQTLPVPPVSIAPARPEVVASGPPVVRQQSPNSEPSLAKVPVTQKPTPSLDDTGLAPAAVVNNKTSNRNLVTKESFAGAKDSATGRSRATTVVSSSSGRAQKSADHEPEASLNLAAKIRDLSRLHRFTSDFDRLALIAAGLMCVGILSLTLVAAVCACCCSSGSPGGKPAVLGSSCSLSRNNSSDHGDGSPNSFNSSSTNRLEAGARRQQSAGCLGKLFSCCRSASRSRGRRVTPIRALILQEEARSTSSSSASNNQLHQLLKAPNRCPALLAGRLTGPMLGAQSTKCKRPVCRRASTLNHRKRTAGAHHGIHKPWQANCGDASMRRASHAVGATGEYFLGAAKTLGRRGNKWPSSESQTLGPGECDINNNNNNNLVDLAFESNQIASGAANRLANSKGALMSFATRTQRSTRRSGSRTDGWLSDDNHSCDSDKSCSPGANKNNLYNMGDAHRAYLAGEQIRASMFVSTKSSGLEQARRSHPGLLKTIDQRQAGAAQPSLFEVSSGASDRSTTEDSGAPIVLATAAGPAAYAPPGGQHYASNANLQPFDQQATRPPAGGRRQQQHVRNESDPFGAGSEPLVPISAEEEWPEPYNEPLESYGAPHEEPGHHFRPSSVRRPPSQTDRHFELYTVEPTSSQHQLAQQLHSLNEGSHFAAFSSAHSAPDQAHRRRRGSSFLQQQPGQPGPRLDRAGPAAQGASQYHRRHHSDQVRPMTQDEAYLANWSTVQRRQQFGYAPGSHLQQQEQEQLVAAVGGATSWLRWTPPPPPSAQQARHEAG